MAKNSFAQEAARDEMSVRQERALLVKVLPEGRATIEDPLAELAELARSAGALVVDRAYQKRRSFNAATCVGKGKLEELRQRIDANEIDVVIFDNDLSPSQIREIERIVSRKVIDRSELILDIFATRARTAEARLQVELAQLEYTAPRLRGMWTHLERIAGAGGGGGVGMVGGVGTRGPGESQIEIDRRLVGKRIAFLKQKLEAIDRRRVREVTARREFFQISLVGYTNAGKSTLMNALTGATAETADQLFMTLDTLTRKWSLGSGRYVLLSDTVGFIRDLPHHLVASFRATLEEAVHADLLLHVVDAANPDALDQIAAVETVLGELGVGDVPELMLLNKVDALPDETLLTILETRHPNAIPISAHSGHGFDQLTAAVDSHMRGLRQDITLSIDVAAGKALSFLDRFADIHDRRYDDGRVLLVVSIAPRALEHLHTIAADVRHVGGDED